MNQYSQILVENIDGLVTLTINRPKALNALNRAVFNELESFFGTDYKNIKGLRGVIITGSGDKAFVAGADIKEFESLTGDEGMILSKRGQDIFFLIEKFHVPVIAAVNGFALGGGCELAMACHMRIADEKAMFGMPEVNLGLIPGYGGTQRLAILVGKAKAMELILTAQFIKADEATRLGLANHKVPVGESVIKAKELIDTISKKGPTAVAKAITCVNACFCDKEDGFKTEYTLFGEQMISEECKEGSAAFVEKRKPEFRRD